MLVLFAVACGMPPLRGSIRPRPGLRLQVSSSAGAPQTSNTSGEATKCAGCHAKETQNLSTDPHGGNAPATPVKVPPASPSPLPGALAAASKSAGCESCHGPAQAHIDSGGAPASITSFTRMPAARINAVCATCHAATMGPWKFEHPPMTEEGCTACHAIHPSAASSKAGSGSAKLLRRDNVNTLCQQCHFMSSSAADPHVARYHDQAGKPQACTACHSHIHGSNDSNLFLK